MNAEDDCDLMRRDFPTGLLMRTATSARSPKRAPLKLAADVDLLAGSALQASDRKQRKTACKRGWLDSCMLSGPQREEHRPLASSISNHASRAPERWLPTLRPTRRASKDRLRGAVGSKAMDRSGCKKRAR